MNVNLDEAGQAVLVEVKNQIVNKVESVADDDERKLVGKLGLLQEVLDLLRVVVVAFPAYTLDLADLACTSSRLYVLEVDLRVLAEVDDGTEVVVETY